MSTYSRPIRRRLWSRLASRYLREPHSPYGPGPHVPAGLRRDDQLVAVAAEVLGEDAPEVELRAAVRRPVVVGEVEVGDAEVECPAQDRAAVAQRAVVAEVLPQPERDRRELQAAAPAAAVGHRLVAVVGGHVQRRTELGVVGHASSIPPRPRSVQGARRRSAVGLEPVQRRLVERGAMARRRRPLRAARRGASSHRRAGRSRQSACS